MAAAVVVVGPVINNIIWWCLIMLIFMSNLGHGESPEMYWKKVLPNSSIPKSIRESLVYRPEWVEDMMSTTSVSVGHGGVGVSVQTGRKGKPGGTAVGVGKGGVSVQTGKGKPDDGTSVGVGKGGVSVHTGKGKGNEKGKPDDGTSVGVGKGGVSVHTGGGSKKHPHRPVYVGVHPGPNPFLYKYRAMEDQVKDDPRVALFFQEKDLHVGSKFNNFQFKSQFQNSTVVVPMLPRKEAASIPFSSDKFPEILERFSISPHSEEAKVMKQTIKECEQQDIIIKYSNESCTCTTSLESMVDMAAHNLGTKAKAVATEIINIRSSSSAAAASASASASCRGNYSVVASKELKLLSNYEQQHQQKMVHVIACHKLSYPYAVFYCHKATKTAVYQVTLMLNNNNNDNSSVVVVKAVAVCHKDTSSWNPNHIAFKLLNIRPGTHFPVCHFLPDDHILWLPAATVPLALAP